MTPRSEPLGPLDITRSARLARSGVWNLVGQLIPALLALIAVPTLIDRLGVDRFGLLSLVWLMIGYFSILDLGLGTALTRAVSAALATRRPQELGPLVWTSVTAMLLLGIAGAGLLVGFGDVIVAKVLRVPPGLHDEALAAVRILASALPLVTATSALTGVLAAHQRFAAINAVRVPLGVFNILGPLALLHWRADLGAITAILVIQRAVAAAVYFELVRRTGPELMRRGSLEPRLLGPLLAFGRWMTVSAVIGPFMVYLDRFLIAGVLSTAAIAYYTAPFDMLSRVWIVSGAITSVLFPALAASLVVDRGRARKLFEYGVVMIYVALLPVLLGCCLFAHEGLRLWLGPEFAAHGAPIVQLLSGGMFVNALAQVALAVVQASGRPRVGAMLHLIELPAYLAAIWLLLRHLGLAGAAIAWTARAAVDAIVLFLVAARALDLPRPIRIRAIVVLAITLAAFAFSAAPLPVRLTAYLVTIVVVVIWVLRSGLPRRALTAFREPLDRAREAV